MKNIITSAIFTLLLVSSFGVKAQWEISEEVKNKKAPNEISQELALKGKKLYNQACVSCHGTPTQADGLLPTATDLGSDKYFDRTEGEAYFQITEGMAAMPGFADKFSDEERWNIVHFIRSYNPESTVDISSIKTINYKIDVKLNDSDKSIVATISADSSVTVSGVKMEFFVKRYFGNLPITAPVVTNEEGTVTVAFPNDIPGDAHGDLEIIVKFENSDLHGTAEFRKNVAWGTHTEYVDILSQRTMWGVGSKAPWWIIGIYFGIVIGVTLTILYVVFQLFLLKKVRNK